MSRKLLLFIFLLVPVSIFIYILMLYRNHFSQITNHDEEFIPKNKEDNYKSFRGSKVHDKLKITQIVSLVRKNEYKSSSKEYIDNILLPNMYTLKQSFIAFLPCMGAEDPYKCGREAESFPKVVDMLNQDKPLMRTHNFTLDILINQENECRKKVTILMGILTRPKEFILRNLYRKIYENYTDTSYLFFTALSLDPEVNEMVKQEADLFKDLIVFNYISSYWRSSSQMIIIYKYLSKYCDNYIYFMYHQGDIYFNYKLFKKMYLNPDNITYPVIGVNYARSEVVRDPNRPWFVPMDLFPNQFYDPYVSGSCFFLSKDTVNNCSKIADTTTPFIWMDDVYTGMLFKRLGIQIEDIMDHANVLYPVYFVLPGIKVIMENYIFLHTLTPGEVLHILYLSELVESGKMYNL